MVLAPGASPTGQIIMFRALIMAITQQHKAAPPLNVKFVATADGNTLPLLLPQPRTSRVYRSQVTVLPEAATPQGGASPRCLSLRNAKVGRLKLRGCFPMVRLSDFDLEYSLLPTLYCLLPTAHSLLPTRYSLLT